MDSETRRFGNSIPALALLTLLLVAGVPLQAVAGWSDLVKDKLYLQHPRTLTGKVFLDQPISGADVRVFDRSGFLIHSADAATGEDGSFSITCPLPESFTVVVSEGLIADEAFEHEVVRTITHFKQEVFYKVNAVTTLQADYLDRHPGASDVSATAAVHKFLDIPGSVDLDEVIYSSEWFCYYFSHYFFMKQAKSAEGLTPYIEQLGDELGAGKTRSFYDTESVGSSLFSDLMGELLSGAASETGSEGAGWILGLLSGGGGDDTRFAEMKTDLQKVLNDLEQIIGALKALADQLALDTNDVETYIQGISAQDAISAIKTHYGPDDANSKGDTNTLKYFSFLTSKDTNAATKAQIATLVDNINGAWDIEDQVQKIHDAIIPDIGATSGLLDLWTQKFLLQGHLSDDQLMDYYKTLERYFAVLLFYQFKGANVVVEALNYQSGSEAQPNGTVEPLADEDTPASNYLKGTFQPQIKEQTDRFLQNVTKLIANNCGLYWETNFLPGAAQEVFARATWFVTQTLGEDHFGLRAGLFGTNNLVADIELVSEIEVSSECAPEAHAAVRPHEPYGTNNLVADIEHVFELGVNSEGAPEAIAAALPNDPTSGGVIEKLVIDVPSKPYDVWGSLFQPDLGTLGKDTKYALTQCDFGAPDAGTTHQLFYRNGVSNKWIYIGSVDLKTYTKDYIQDSSGDISYAYLLASFRHGGKNAVMDPSALKPHYYHNDHDGDVNWWHDRYLKDDYLHLWVHGKNKYYNSGSNISMKDEWWHRFTFQGSKSTTAYLNIDGKITGSVYIYNENNWSQDADIGFHIGVYDDTHSKILKRTDDEKKASDAGTVQDYSKIPEKQISFTLEPGISYYVYANIYGDGNNSSGSFEYKCSMYLKRLSLSFVDSEF